MTNNNQQAFFALVRAGLWGGQRLVPGFKFQVPSEVDWEKVYQLAQEQAVQGLLLQGIEDLKANGIELSVPKVLLLQLIGEVQIIEQRNKVMNQFIADLVAKLREADIYTFLVKGQGIAQCYERPQWRTSGDVDLLLSAENFEKAKSLLLPLSSGNKPECNYSKELGYYIDSWSVELHGTQRTGLSSRVDAEIDAVQMDLFYGEKVRPWINEGTTIFLPAADEDVFIVFTHFVKHFYKEGGVTVRQMCDWCRLLWTYKDSLNHKVLERRIERAGLKSEWKAFGRLAVDYLGMPMEAMPLYSKDEKWSRKADKIIAYILKGGEWRKYKDTLIVSRIFPLSILRFAPGILLNVNWLKIKERIL
jgi:hypothetical protein